MENKFSYLKKFIQVILWPVLIGIGQFLIVAALTTIFTFNKFSNIKKEYPNYTDNKIIEIINNSDIQKQLTSFLESNIIFIIMFSLLIILPILIKFYKKYHQGIKKRASKKELTMMIILGLSFSIAYNVVATLLGSDAVNPNISIYFILLIISKGIIGPIIEEYLYRGIVYNKLKTFNKKNTALVITTLIFSFMHNNIFQIVLAFLLGLILIKIYDKYENMLYPIIIHIIVNLVAILFTPYIQNFNIIINIAILIISTIIIFLILRRRK